MFKLAIIVLNFPIFILGSKLDIHFMEENDFPAYGEVWINLGSNSSDTIISYDTLNFDNLFLIETVSILDPTLGCGSNNFYSIVFKNHDNPLWGEGLNQMGYMFSDSLKSVPILYQDILFTSGNVDTVWENSINFPDSLFPLDSVFDWFTEFQGIGKYFAEDHYDYCGGGFGYSGLENFNSIIYLKLTNNYIVKIQIIEVVGTNTPPPSDVHRAKLRYQIENALDNIFTTNVMIPQLRINFESSSYYDVMGREYKKIPNKNMKIKYYRNFRNDL